MPNRRQSAPPNTTEVDTLRRQALIRFTANDIYQTSAPRVVRRPILLFRGAQLSCSAVVAEGAHPALSYSAKQTGRVQAGGSVMIPGLEYAAIAHQDTSGWIRNPRVKLW